MAKHINQNPWCWFPGAIDRCLKFGLVSWLALGVFVDKSERVW